MLLDAKSRCSLLVRIAMVAWALPCWCCGQDQRVWYSKISLQNNIVDQAGVALGDGESVVPEWRSQVEGFWVPVLAMQGDIDSDEPEGGVEFEADVESGPGWGVRYDLVNTESRTAFGGLYIGTSHTERQTGRDVDVHAAYVTVSGDFEPVEGILTRVTLGAGGVVVDFSQSFDDTGGGALMIAGGFGLEVTESLRAGIDGGGFLWGYPGETIAYGGFCTLSLACRF
jgi:hypothetical protein